MSRPRKNPNDPKWETIKDKEIINNNELTEIKLFLYASSLAGVIAQAKPITHEQAAKNAMEYTEAALKIWG